MSKAGNQRGRRPLSRGFWLVDGYYVPRGVVRREFWPVVNPDYRFVRSIWRTPLGFISLRSALVRYARGRARMYSLSMALNLTVLFSWLRRQGAVL
jgi:hypothetical protein